MSRIAPTGISAVRPRMTSEHNNDGKPRADDRGRTGTRWADVSRVPEIPSIQQLRSRFQPSDVPRTAPGNRAATAETSGFSDIQPHATAEQQSSRKRTNPEDAMYIEDPEKYFESTNHTERFQQTRALFAKMEEQTRLDQERRRQSSLYRSKSPTRFPVSSRSSLVISQAVNTVDNKTSSPSPDQDHQSPRTKITRYGSHEPRVERTRVLSASTDVRDVKMVEPSPPLDRDRSSSVDRLDDDDSSYESSSLRDSSKFFSRSESDLGRSVRESMPSAKLLMQHYEDVVRKNAAIFGGQIQRRRPPQSGLDSLQKDKVMKPPIADKKPLYPISRPGAEVSSSGSSNLRQNYPDRTGALPKVQPTSAKVSLSSGRLEESSSTGFVSEKPAQSGSSAVSKPVVSNKDQPPRSVRRSADIEDESVVQSIEAWKTRRRSNKNDDQEREAAQQIFDEKPPEVTDHRQNIVSNTEAGRDSAEESIHQSESTTPNVLEPSSIFGVALRSAASTSEDTEVKQPPTELEVETKVPDVDVPVESTSMEPVSAPHPEVDLPGEVVMRERQTLADVLPDDVDSEKDIAVDGMDMRGKRTSVELAEVPHFPKDSMLLTGGNLSTSPRSSLIDGHHLPPPSAELKHDEHIKDSVFMKNHTPTDHSGPQVINSNVPLASTLPETDVASGDEFLSETNQ